MNVKILKNNVRPLAIRNSGTCFLTSTGAFANTFMGGINELTTYRLTKLSLGCILIDHELETMYAIMPNLKELQVYLDDEQFGIICSKWKKLRVLIVFGYGLTDSGLLGTKTAQLMKREGGDGIRRGILELTELVKFGFWSCQLTPLSVMEGFLRMGKLNQVRAYSTDVYFEKDVIKAMEKKKITFRGRSPKYVNKKQKFIDLLSFF